jgi:hypothetical protein
MSSENFLQVVQLSTIVIGFLGVAVSMRSHRRQMHAQMFIEFSARFHEVVRALPAQAWIPDEAGAETLPPRSEELTKASLQCFHIVAALFHLHKGGFISPELWQPWQRGIRRTMQGRLLQREWAALEKVFDHVPDFCRYMRGMSHEKTDHVKTKTRGPRGLWSHAA